jgi:elongation factor 1 alpha-like protein
MFWCLKVVLHCHHAKEPAKVTKLVSLLDPKGQVIANKKPRCLLANQRAIVEVGSIDRSIDR